MSAFLGAKKGETEASPSTQHKWLERQGFFLRRGLYSLSLAFCHSFFRGIRLLGRLPCIQFAIGVTLLADFHFDVDPSLLLMVGQELNRLVNFDAEVSDHPLRGVGVALQDEAVGEDRVFLIRHDLSID